MATNDECERVIQAVGFPKYVFFLLFFPSLKNGGEMIEMDPSKISLAHILSGVETHQLGDDFPKRWASHHFSVA